jgi:hypothetical protein
MNGPLALYAERIAAFAALERDIGDQAGLLWRVLVHAVLGLRDRHPDWLFIRYKDLTRDPEAGFRTICGHVGLPFSREVQREIEDTTSTKNPTDATSARPRSHFLRDTAAIVDRWKRELSSEEVDRTRAWTEPTASVFYTRTGKSDETSWRSYGRMR